MNGNSISSFVTSDTKTFSSHCEALQNILLQGNIYVPRSFMVGVQHSFLLHDFYNVALVHCLPATCTCQYFSDCFFTQNLRTWSSLIKQVTSDSHSSTLLGTHCDLFRRKKTSCRNLLIQPSFNENCFMQLLYS